MRNFDPRTLHRGNTCPAYLTLHAELEQRVQDRTAELEGANRELAGFSYTVSHDLKAPLRAISGYASLLGQHLVGALDDEGQRLLRSIAYNGHLMGSLVEGLLDFTRTRSRDLVRVPVDMSALAGQVLADLVSVPGRDRLRSVVADLPPVHEDRDLAAAALRHLLTNAIRFSAGRPDPVVEVGFETGTDGPVYFVNDHGIGFDARKHGGRVWAEGEVGKGTTCLKPRSPVWSSPGPPGADGDTLFRQAAEEPPRRAGRNLRRSA